MACPRIAEPVKFSRNVENSDFVDAEGNCPFPTLSIGSEVVGARIRSRRFDA